MIKSTPMLMTYENAARILNGTKTETRRIVKPQPTTKVWILGPNGREQIDTGAWDWRCRNRHHKCLGTTWEIVLREMMAYAPFGKPGDQIWFKSPHYRLGRYRGRRFFPVKGAHAILKLPNDGVEKIPRSKRGWHLRPSIFMPKKLARLTATIVSVGVERLMDITDEGVRAEGIRESDFRYPLERYAKREHWRCEFRFLWESIHGQYPSSWLKNPYVWVIKFARVKHHA